MCGWGWDKVGLAETVAEWRSNYEGVNSDHDDERCEDAEPPSQQHPLFILPRSHLLRCLAVRFKRLYRFVVQARHQGLGRLPKSPEHLTPIRLTILFLFFVF